MNAAKKRTLLVLGALFLALLLVFCRHQGSEQYRIYHQLDVGMTERDVEGLFDRDPDFTCTYKAKTILYFCNRFSIASHTPSPKEENPACIEKRADIPDIYDAIQVMINDSGKVEAYTWNGETYTIFTLYGEVKGANVNKLDEKHFE